jgi:uncharacterized protein (TIGR03435 family)
MKNWRRQGGSLAMRFILLGLLGALTTLPAFANGSAQSPIVSSHNETPTLNFDVASVRENKSGLPPTGDEPDSNVPLGPGNVYSPTGGFFTAKNITLMEYIGFAYRMTDNQYSSFKSMAPDWVDKDRFNIQARTEKSDVTKDELRLMMRSLLKERFGLAAHYETKQVPVYALRLINPQQLGPKLQTHPAQDSCPSILPNKAPDSGPPPSETITGGFPTTCGGIILLPSSVDHRINIGGRNITLTLFVNSLTDWGQLNRPVVDRTGLRGNVDFVLEYVPELRPNPTSPEPPDIATDTGGPYFREALKQQLGLKLDSEKGDIQVILLDHIEHPLAN